jgi:hypothetical protein
MTHASKLKRAVFFWQLKAEKENRKLRPPFSATPNESNQPDFNRLQAQRDQTPQISLPILAKLA